MKLPTLFVTAILTFSLNAQEGGKEKARPVVPAVKEATQTQKRTPVKPEVASKTPSSRAIPVPEPEPSILWPRYIPPSNSGSEQVNDSVLTENIMIQLKGSVQGSPELDLSLTGIGPVFSADVFAGKERGLLTHRYTVQAAKGGYRVEYTIGMRIKMEAKMKAGMTSIEYGNVMVSGVVLAKEGKKVVISKNGEHELSLTLGKVTSD